MPPTYVSRLKTIHAAVTKHVYGAEAIITTPETSEGKYETYITVANHTHRYNEIPMKTAATIETMAIYQSLRYITNVLGYKIVDLNYPTLSMLVSTINKHNADIILLQTCVSAISGHTETMYEGFIHLQDEFNMITTDDEDIQHIHTLMDQMMTYIENYRSSITDLFHQFMDSKVIQMHSTTFHICF